MKRLFLVWFIIICSTILYSQNITPVDIKYFDKSYANGKISINQSSELESFFETYVGLNKKRRGFYGYRIKVYAQNSPNARAQANSIRVGFEESQKAQKAYVTYVEPNFEVHIGDFTNRFEAVAFLNEISEIYPEAYVIRTVITFPNRGDNEK